MTIELVGPEQMSPESLHVTGDALVSGENDTEDLVNDKTTLEALRGFCRTPEKATPNELGVKTSGVTYLCRETHKVIGERHMSTKQDEHPHFSREFGKEFGKDLREISNELSKVDPTKGRALLDLARRVDEASSSSNLWSGSFCTTLHQTWLENEGCPIEAYSCGRRMVAPREDNGGKCKNQEPGRKQLSHGSFFASDTDTLLKVTVEINMWPVASWGKHTMCNEREM